MDTDLTRGVSPERLRGPVAAAGSRWSGASAGDAAGRVLAAGAQGQDLERLRRQAQQAPDKALQQAVSQFEALFMKQVLSTMRKAVPKAGWLDGPGSDVMTDMLDGELAKTLSSQSTGLSRLIMAQLSPATPPAPIPPGGLPLAAPPEGLPVSRSVDRLDSPQELRVRAVVQPPSMTVRREGTATVPFVTQDAESVLPLDPALRVGDALAPGQRAFVSRLWPHALQVQAQTGVPAAYLVGQAALETGWGERDIRTPDGQPTHNLFGIKAGSGWQGPKAQVNTHEFVAGERQATQDDFRAYRSFAESFQDWVQLMSSRPAYRRVLQSGSPAEFGRRLQEAGYATDPGYGEKLERVIQRTMKLRQMVL